MAEDNEFNIANCNDSDNEENEEMMQNDIKLIKKVRNKYLNKIVYVKEGYEDFYDEQINSILPMKKEYVVRLKMIRE